MKYPKPGYNNPLVSVYVFDLEQYESALGIPAASATHELEWPGRHPKNNSIISEVAWVGNATLIVKELNRAADDGNVILFDINASDEASRSIGHVVRKKGKNGEEGDDGWIESVCITSSSCSYNLPLTIAQTVPNYLPSASSNFH
jgi:dipeptidyl aminopeptidase B